MSPTSSLFETAKIHFDHFDILNIIDDWWKGKKLLRSCEVIKYHNNLAADWEFLV